MKKLVVKNFRPPPQRSDPKTYLEKVWAQLDEALSDIFETGQVTKGKSNEELYRGVENVCRQGEAPALCDRVEKRCKAFVEEAITGRLLQESGIANGNVLRATLDSWDGWNIRVKTIRQIFFFMDRAYLLQSGKTSLQDLSLHMFRDFIFENTTLNSKVVDGACDMVDADRKGADMDEATFKRAIAMFHDLSIYTWKFEPRLLALSQSFILEWSNKASAEMELPAYVTQSVDLMSREMQRCERFGLDLSTRRELLTLLEEHLIHRQQDKLSMYFPNVLLEEWS